MSNTNGQSYEALPDEDQWLVDELEASEEQAQMEDAGMYYMWDDGEVDDYEY